MAMRPIAVLLLASTSAMALQLAPIAGPGLRGPAGARLPAVSSVSSGGRVRSPAMSQHRRDALSKAAKILGAGIVSGAALQAPSSANAATGANIFEAPLHNRYFLVRAGEIVWENKSQDALTTNPVHKLHVDNCGLSPDGIADAMEAAEDLRTLGYGANTEGWVWHSIHAAAAQTAQIISSHHGVTLNHVIPEYSFLDQRGYGALEGRPVDFAREVVWTQDALNSDFRPQESSKVLYSGFIL
jgi:hypothetical protein